MTACREVQASFDPAADSRRASPSGWPERMKQKRHSSERVDMNKHEAARIAARLKEVEEKVARLEDLVRRAAERGPATSSAPSSRQ